MRFFKKGAFLGLTLLAVATVTSCKKDQVSTKNEYSYVVGTTALGNNWNPHTWETNAESSILSYIESPFVDMSIKNSSTGEYQWVYEMAESVTDVTAEHKTDLTKYGSILPEGTTAENVSSGYVYEIKLNQNAKWENGEAITADDYVYSMEQLLSSKMRNYRANLYYSGESAVAGALDFYNSEAPLYSPVVPAYEEGETPDYSFDVTNNKVYINTKSTEMTVAQYSLNDIMQYLDPSVLEEYTTLLKSFEANVNGYGYVEVDPTDENLKRLLTLYLTPFGAELDDNLLKEFLFYVSGTGAKTTFDTVGLYKVDNYTINYVLQSQQDIDYFLTSLTSTWLVYEPLYEQLKKNVGDLVTTTYGTSKETTMAYGPYKLESFEQDKQMVFVQNENWYGYTKKEDGSLYSETQFDVDGKRVQQYQTTRVVMNVMDETTAKQAFLRGELTEWSPSANELSQYSLSDQLYKVDETYTMSIFFNSDLNALKTMDSSKGNKNSVVISNSNFRKALSLAIDRADWVSTTAGYKPTYSLMNDLYYYDIFEDPTSRYRDTEQAMKAIVELYGVQYGEGQKYATLKEAYNSITGYNLAEAKALMKQACEELVAAGLYTKGENIVINMAWAKGALTDDDNAQATKLQQFFNAALEGSGFGTITLNPVGNLSNRYAEVPNGNYAIGYGAWGGAAFYPFRNLDVYFSPDLYELNEAACWDPTTETFTMTVNGVEVTKTYREWAYSLYGAGEYANSSFETRLEITSALEKQFLSFYYRIPLASTTICSMLSYQANYYTSTYQIMYGFGGLRLMNYNYTDAEWVQYVAENGGSLNYQ